MIENLDPLVVALATIGFFLGGLLKGVVGLGLPLVAIPIVAIAMPVDKAIPLMLAPGYIANLLQVRQTWHARTSLLPWWPAIGGMIIGVVVGVQIATSAPDQLVKGVLGTLVVVFVLTGFARLELPPRFGSNRFVGFGMGGLTGLSGGLTGGFGATLAMYLLACRLEKDQFVWVIGMILFVGVTALSASLIHAGSFKADQLAGTLAVLIPSWLGLTAGGYVRRRVSQQVFRNTAMMVLLVLGISLIAGAIR